MLLLRSTSGSDAVDAGNGGRIEDFALFVKIDLEVICGLLKIHLFNFCSSMLSDLGRNLFEQHLLKDVVEGDAADELLDV